MFCFLFSSRHPAVAPIRLSRPLIILFTLRLPSMVSLPRRSCAPTPERCATWPPPRSSRAGDWRALPWTPSLGNTRGTRWTHSRREATPRHTRPTIHGHIESLIRGWRVGQKQRPRKERTSVQVPCVRSSAQRESDSRATLGHVTMLLSLSFPLFSPLLFSSPLGLWPSARGDGDSRCESPGRPNQGGRLPHAGTSAPLGRAPGATALYLSCRSKQHLPRAQ